MFKSFAKNNSIYLEKSSITCNVNFKFQKTCIRSCARLNTGTRLSIASGENLYLILINSNSFLVLFLLFVKKNGIENQSAQQNQIVRPLKRSANSEMFTN